MRSGLIFQMLLFTWFITSCGDSKVNEKQKVLNDTATTTLIESEKLHHLSDSSQTVASDSIQKSEVLIQVHPDSTLVPIEAQPIDTNLFATIPPELSHRLNNYNIPTEATIGMKSYPNAYIFQLNQGVEYAGKTYVTIELASVDKPEKVLEYYKQWKDKWFYVEGAGIHTFKKDEDKYFRETNTLQILPFNRDLYMEIDTLLPFKAQSLIRVYYEVEK